MADAASNVLHFGDQTVEIESCIQELYRLSKASPALSLFLQISTDTLRAAVFSLPPEDRSALSFRTLRDLAARFTQRKSGRSATVAAVLLCISQLGYLLHHMEQQPHVFLAGSRKVMLGLCTGMVPAATAACITSVAELLRICPEIIRISLRLGLQVSRRSHILEPTNESWTLSFGNVSFDSLQDAISKFHDTNSIPPSIRLYVSVLVSNSSFTVSGPPRILGLFSKSADKYLPQARKNHFPVYGAYHASHIHGTNIEPILGDSPLLNIPLSPNTSIISTSSGRTMNNAQTLRDLLHESLLDILRHPLNFTAVTEGLNSSGMVDPILTAIGPSNMAKSLQRSLKWGGYCGPAESKIKSNAGGDTEPPGSFAIVGMSGRFPGGENIDSLWEVLEEGLDLHRNVPEDRFNSETHCDPTGQKQNSTLTSYGCFMDNLGHFDARLFNMSPREATSIDPAHRLLLMTTYEALQMSGYSPNRTPSTQTHRIGTFMGQTSDDWREVNAGQNIDAFWTPGGMRAFGPGRLNYHFGWEGPSYSCDAACSSSMAAIQVGVHALANRECDMAVAGGANILISSEPFAGLSRGGFLSMTGSCKTWDSKADGYCRADGVGVVVIKRLEDAIADQDRIQAVIRSISTNHSAEAISITHPHAGTQQRLFTTVLNDACVEPDQIGYVETHGTGTQAGDPIETSAVAEALSSRGKDSHPCYISSIKPNIGHSESASGVAAMIKSVLMLQRNVIPPHIGIKGTINPKVPLQRLEALNIRIPMEKTPFKADPSGDGKRRILVNNFNAAGGNTSMILEDPHEPEMKQSRDPRICHIVTATAKTHNSLRGNIDRLLDFLKQNPDTDISDLAYSTTARQMHHTYRKAYVATDTLELISSIEGDVSESDLPPRSSGAVFLFTGQGSLYTGLGHQLFSTSKSFERRINEIEEICKMLNLPSVLEPISNPDFDYARCGSVQGQLVIVAFEIALAQLWESLGVSPQLVTGHSLGTYAALCVAGVLSVHDTIYLVGQRGLLIERHCKRGTHAMIVANLSAERLEQLLAEGGFPSCEIACFNGPETTVASGTVGDIDALNVSLGASGMKTSIIQVPYAFHSAQLDPCLNEFEGIAQQIHFNEPRIPVASTLLGKVVSEAGVFDAKYLVRQTRQPVNFMGAIRSWSTRKDFNPKATFWVEVGPRPLCLPMVKSVLGSSPIQTLPSVTSKEENWFTLSKSIAKAYRGGLSIDWNEMHKEYEPSLRLLPLPSYAFDLKDYWLKYEDDWLMHKFDKATPKDIAPPENAFSTTTLQRIEREEFTEDFATVTFVSNLAHPDLSAAVSGHLVNDSHLCPSSVYADMAFTAASYIWNRTEKGEVPAMNVSGIEVRHPLIFSGKDQFVRVTASRKAKAQSVTLEISSQGDAGDRTEQTAHAECEIHYGDGKAWMSEWAKQQYLIKGRVSSLEKAARNGEIHHLKRNIAYKLFGSFVKYTPKFQGMENVTMDAEMLEATAKIRFQTTPADGTFTCSPYWVDSIAHLSGFILNVSEAIPEDLVYISHGWGGMRIARPLSENGNYQTYVRMQESEKDVMSGDVYIFEQDTIIGVVSDLKFRAIKRKFIDILLPSAKAAPAPALVSTPAPAPVVQQQQQQRSIPKVATKPSLNISVPGQQSGPSFSRIISCLSEEMRVPAEELNDNTDLADIGLDSLMAIIISDRLRKESQIDIPTSTFLSCLTIRDVRRFFEGQQPENSEVNLTSESSLSSHTPEIKTPTSTEARDFVGAFRDIIAAECGLDSKEIQPDSHFVELGIDSLFSLSIIKTVQEQTGQILPSSVFDDCPTFEEFEQAFGTPCPSEPPTAVLRPCQSVLLQGEATSTAPALFLLPDGSGSAGSYAGLPVLGKSGRRVWGIHSPFLRCPEEFDASLQEVAEMYVAEILRLDSKGPFFLGGWSIGGIYAYEAARILRQKGKTVQGLFLIDAPCPGNIPPMPHETVDLLDRLGITKANKSRADNRNIREHFRGSIESLKRYNPQSMMDGNAPACLALWAREGVWESVDEEERRSLQATWSSDNEAQRWIMDAREWKGANGWESYLPNVQVEVVSGNHFSLMRRPQIANVATVLARYLDIIF